MDDGSADAVIFLELKKTFDNVDHELLIQKVASYGITDNNLLFLRS